MKPLMPNSEEVKKWFEAQGINYNLAYRTVIIIEPGKPVIARNWRFKANEDGRPYIDPETNDAAKEDVEVHILSELPPL